MMAGSNAAKVGTARRGTTRRRMDWPEFARPSLAFSVAMGLVTLFHHLHSALTLDPAGMHVVINELVLIPLTVLSMLAFLRSGNRLALWVYAIIALLGFVGLALYEGGWNHTVKIIVHLAVDGPATDIETILPSGNVHRWFHEITGVLTFLVATIAAYYNFRFLHVAFAR